MNPQDFIDASGDEPETMQLKPVPDFKTVEEARVYVESLIESVCLVPGTEGYIRHLDGKVPLALRIGQYAKSGADYYLMLQHAQNLFIKILGASGSGKTELLKRLASLLNVLGVPVLIFDFHSDVDPPHFNTIELSARPGCRNGFNPLSFSPADAEMRGMFQIKKDLVEMIRLAEPSLGNRQAGLLQEALSHAYAVKGIEDDEPWTWSNPPPTFADVTEFLRESLMNRAYKSISQSVSGLLGMLESHFVNPIFGRPDSVSMERLMTSANRMDLSSLDTASQIFITDTILRLLWARVKSMGPVLSKLQKGNGARIFVVIDEVSIFTSSRGGKEHQSRIFNILASEGRKYGIGLIVASQQAVHLSEAMHQNFNTEILMRVNSPSDAVSSGRGSVAGQELMKLGVGEGFVFTSQRLGGDRVRFLRAESEEGYLL